MADICYIEGVLWDAVVCEWKEME